ncbi:MAG: hypothetical protein LBF82_03925, partial [Lactobacillales bacterium]|nr:hypothetical protein [Lactobacillales bacterium]
MIKDHTVDYKIMKLVANIYMKHGMAEEKIENDLLKVHLKRGDVDNISLYINDKPKMKIEVNRTVSNIIEFDKKDSNALKYILPFSKSLGVSKTQLDVYQKRA